MTARLPPATPLPPSKPGRATWGHMSGSKPWPRRWTLFKERSLAAGEESARCAADGGSLRSRVADLTLAVAGARVTSAQGHEEVPVAR